jgi:chemotaxis protein MotB
MKGDQPVIIVKKGGHGHGGHHGGAWKVAYADFVTAMMAFFLVMWIVGQSNPMKAGVAGYFRDPGVFERGTGGSAGIMPGAPKGITSPTPTPNDTDIAVAKEVLEQAAQRMREAIEQLPDFAKIKDRVDIEVTSEGLRIELIDTANDSFFQVGSAELHSDSKQLLGVIANELGKIPNRIAVEGHTDGRAFEGRGGYGNWELSADRANASRRLLAEAGIADDRFASVTGRGDRDPLISSDPAAAGNRRISITLLREKSPEELAASQGGGTGAGPGRGAGAGNGTATTPRPGPGPAPEGRLIPR